MVLAPRLSKFSRTLFLWYACSVVLYCPCIILLCILPWLYNYTDFGCTLALLYCHALVVLYCYNVVLLYTVVLFNPNTILLCCSFYCTISQVG